MLNVLELKMWEKAGLLKDRVFKKDADLLDAINFLELFSMYALQAGMINSSDNFETKKTKHEDIREYPRVTKLITLLETLSKMNLKGGASEKALINIQIERTIKLADKILVHDLSKTNAIALAKYVNKAEKILKKFSS